MRVKSLSSGAGISQRLRAVKITRALPLQSAVGVVFALSFRHSRYFCVMRLLVLVTTRHFVEIRDVVLVDHDDGAVVELGCRLIVLKEIIGRLRPVHWFLRRHVCGQLAHA